MYRYQLLKAGSIQANGWIYEQLSNDLTEGYIGEFDDITNTVSQNLFVKQERLSHRTFRFVKEWWSGEHEGYWKDAIVRMAFLTGNEAYKKRTHQWMNNLVTHAGKNGYIGIYAENDEGVGRFNHKGGNGELWTTSRIIMAMLAYYEFTGDEAVFQAAKKAVDLIIKEYQDNNYFAETSRGGGVSHGVGFFENLEWMYRITGEKKYLNFSVKLYEDFNRGEVRDDDLKRQHLLDENRLFRKHGAHIAEGLFVPQWVAAISQQEKDRQAAENAIKKLEYHLTPGGAMRADEFIKERAGTADERYEYCGITEMISPLSRITSLTGDLSMADKIETMAFNAAQGARLPKLTALSYLTTDNRIRINQQVIGRRESYAAVHPAAACCALSGGRLMPYFVEGMWMRDNKTGGLAAMLYGPSSVRVAIDGISVHVKSETQYPFSDQVRMHITPEQTHNFTLTLRKPHGCDSISLHAPEQAQIKEYSDRFEVQNRWKKGDELRLNFHFPIRQIAQPESRTLKKGGYYLQRGPLVYALPFGYKADTVREYNNTGFHLYRMKPETKLGWNWKIPVNANFRFQQDTISGNGHLPWAKPPVTLKGQLVDSQGQPRKVTLVPMGATVFRRVSFPVAETQ